MDGRELVSRVIDAGLVAKYCDGSNVRIIGGTSCKSVELETGAVIDVYQQGFHVCLAPEGWVVRVSRPRNHDLEVEVSELEQALAVVLDAHGITK